MPFITHRLQAYYLNIRQMLSVYINPRCKHVWELLYMRLRRSSSIGATLSTTACLSSRIVMIRLRKTRSFRNPPHRKKSGAVRSGDWAGQAMSPKLRIQVTRCCTFQPLSCDWPYETASCPLPFPFPPTATSYRACTIFKFEMCQSAPRHPVFSWKFKTVIGDWLACGSI
jgi:hypothetical protein